jgi:putative membrane protein insertion efficiency factor
VLALSTPAGAAVAVAAIHVYQHTMAPLLERAGVRCRFTPTCSHYAEAVIARDGLLRGGLATARRILRCTPLTPMGTHDEP